jgi:chemotaxis signal transduction protein
MNADGNNLSIPDGLREFWASQLAAEPSAALSGTKIRRFVFRVGAEWFGLDPRALSLTLPDVRPRQLPHRAGGLLEGLINADGRIVVCLRMPHLWDILASQTPSGAGRRVLVFQIEGWSFAIRAEEVQGIEEFAEDTIGPISSGAPEALRHCAQGIVFHEGKAVSLLQAGPFAELARKKLQ